VSTRTVVDCDLCPAQDIATTDPIVLCLGREFNGVEMEEQQQAYHLCPTCAHATLRRICRRLASDPGTSRLIHISINTEQLRELTRRRKENE
jgi:hypothetical protein